MPVNIRAAALPILAVATLFGAALQPLGAQSVEERPQIMVSADASVDVEPDRATVDVAVETQAETAQAASRENADKMTALLAELRRLGVPDRRIRTVSYQIHPVYARHRPDQRGPEEPRIVGYRTVNMVRVVVDSIPRVGTIVDAAVARGGNRVSGIMFEVSDPSEARAEALRRATAIARGDAAVLAEALGVSLGAPLRVSTSYARPMPPPSPMMRGDVMEMAQAAPTPVEGGTIQVRADVHIVFAIER